VKISKKATDLYAFDDNHYFISLMYYNILQPFGW